MTSNASFVIPVYNGKEFLRQAIESCLDQTLRPDSVIVVDDASTDGSADIIRELARKHADVVVPVFRPQNGGRSLARNSGIERVRTKYCLFLDADDAAEPTRVERQVSFMEQNPDVFASSSFVLYMDGTGRTFANGKLDVLTREQYAQRMESGEPIGFFSPATIVRTSVFTEDGLLFREPFRQAQDVDLWNRISEKYLILAQPEFLTKYRIHGESVTTRKYYRSRLYYEYVRDCMRRRRNGSGERSWDEFVTFWKNRPVATRLASWRKTSGKKFFRDAGFALARRNYAAFAANWLLSVAFQPSYALRRTFSRLGK